MSNLIGQSLGRYHILEQLGDAFWGRFAKSGMATVYEAYDACLEREMPSSYERYAVRAGRTEFLLAKDYSFLLRSSETNHEQFPR